MNKKITVSAEQIDALLPQTQCGLCDYAGCKPYAQAIVNDNERIDRCPPGGIATLQALAILMQQDATGMLLAMREKEKPTQVVEIREQECIGCTKCIQACPVDAIVGAAKLMHTVILDACTGCELCIPPCPVDCIDIKTISSRDQQAQQQFTDQSRQRYHQHQARQQKQQHEQNNFAQQKQTVSARQSAIQAALERVNQKKAVTS